MTISPVPGRCTRSEAARKLGVSVSAIIRWERAFPAEIAPHAGIPCLPVTVDDGGIHWHDRAVVARLAAALARTHVARRGRRREPGEVDADVFDRLSRGQSIADVVRELRVPAASVLRLATIFSRGSPGGTLVPAELAAELTAELGTASAAPREWLLAARALRARMRGARP